MIDAINLVGILFSGLSALVIEDVGDEGGAVVVRARTPGGAVACPGCATKTGRVHGYHERTVADVPVGGRRVVVMLRARRMRCPVLGCAVQTFREQVPDVVGRYQRRTVRLAGQVEAAVRALAGRAGSRLLAALGIAVSRHTALRVLLAVPLPGLELDLKAATAAVTLQHHNGRTEGVNTKTKKIKRDMFGRAGFELLRHRILLGLGTYPHHRKCDRASLGVLRSYVG